ncbi:LamG-like jellyroll fold domain-containing protein [Kaarinaea lacus]
MSVINISCRAGNTLIFLCILFITACNSAVEDLDDEHLPKSGLQCDGNSPIAEYLFNEGSGTTVRDYSAVEPPMDLDIRPFNLVGIPDVTWLASNGLRINQAVQILSVNPAEKLISAVTASNALSVELWLTPQNATQTGPARIVSISVDAAYRNLTIGQFAGKYILRLRTSETDLNGEDPNTADSVLETEAGTVDTKTINHLVQTWSQQSSSAKFYLDGTLAATSDLGGNFSNWDNQFQLILANELNVDRTWLGDLYYLAIYDCVLSEAQINSNFVANQP